MTKNEFIEKRIKKRSKKVVKKKVKKIKSLLQSTQYDLESAGEYRDKYWGECIKTWNEIEQLEKTLTEKDNEISELKATIKQSKTNTMNHYEELVKRLTIGIDNGSSSLLDLQQLNTIVKYIEQVEREAISKGVEKEIYIVFDENKDIHKVYYDSKLAETYCRKNKDTGYVCVNPTQDLRRESEPTYNVPIKFEEPENECCIEPGKLYMVTSTSPEKTKYFKEYSKALDYLQKRDQCTSLKAIFIE